MYYNYVAYMKSCVSEIIYFQCRFLILWPAIVRYFLRFFFFSIFGQGASLLLMLKTYLSEDVFQHAIILYLHNHSYASIQSDDLWDSFNEVSGLDSSVLSVNYERSSVYISIAHINGTNYHTYKWYQ